MKPVTVKEKIVISRKNSFINIFENAAREAGKELINDFGKIDNSQVKSKDVGDFVTTADIKTEKILLEILQQSYPRSKRLVIQHCCGCSKFLV